MHLILLAFLQRAAMKTVLCALAVWLSLHGAPTQTAAQMCVSPPRAVMAAKAQAPERKLPIGEWCQRPATQMSPRAHPCQCAQANCLDKDPDHLPAHTDVNCLSYCTVAACACVHDDCP